MKQRVPAFALALFALLAISPTILLAQKTAPSDIAKRVQRARDVTAIISDRLRSELGMALKSGAAAAIGMCQTISPDLVTNASDEFKFEVSRPGVRLRNPENAPDEWEQKVLDLFQGSMATGSDATKLEHHELVTTPEGDKLFRYMKPIVMTEMCMSCHGTEVKQDVKAEIARYYPDDKAIGFRLGELRGAFSLVQLIEE